MEIVRDLDYAVLYYNTYFTDTYVHSYTLKNKRFL
jgi:hypothetical protein